MNLLDSNLFADIFLYDRFGHPVQPQEWFLVPLFVIEEAVDRIKDGTITAMFMIPRQRG